jgi:hypothetical protein
MRGKPFFHFLEKFFEPKNGFFSASDYTIALRSVESGRQIFRVVR